MNGDVNGVLVVIHGDVMVIHGVLWWFNGKWGYQQCFSGDLVVI